MGRDREVLEDRAGPDQEGLGGQVDLGDRVGPDLAGRAGLADMNRAVLGVMAETDRADLEDLASRADRGALAGMNRAALEVMILEVQVGRHRAGRAPKARDREARALGQNRARLEPMPVELDRPRLDRMRVHPQDPTHRAEATRPQEQTHLVAPTHPPEATRPEEATRLGATSRSGGRTR